uniref:Chitin-binding type-2 domain-containing protein n=1 Tax=Anopheles culicifacies TaxID=139723 RepID=A0A182M4E7_9DIPT
MAKIQYLLLTALLMLLTAICFGQESTTLEPGDEPFVEVLYRRILRLRCPDGQRCVAEDLCAESNTVPHPTNCHNYLECMDDKFMLLTCDDQYYNTTSGECTSEEPASCYQRKLDESAFDGETYLGRAVVDPCTPYRPGFKLPHPENCGFFYQCTQSGAALFACPANLLFHAKLKVCVWPQQVECVPGAILPTSTTTVQTSPNDDDYSDDNFPDEICEPGCFLDLRCLVDCDPIIPPKVFPHPSRCDAYFTCNSYGYSCVTECPVGTWFSSIFQRCVVPELSECTPFVPPICNEPDCRPNPDCPVPDTNPPTKLPHPDRDDWYYICRDGSSCQMSSPTTTTTTVAPVTTTTTVAPVTTTTTQISTTPDVDCPTCPPSNCFPDDRCPKCEKCDPTFFPHDNCDMFYKCSFGLICEMKCPPGLHFNARENVCDWPTQAGCEYPPIIEDPPENVACHPNPQCPPGNAIEVFLPHPSNCSQFYKCSWGNACLKECPDGLHWSTAKMRCEWPFLAGCDPNIPPNDPNCPTCPCIPCRSQRNACHPSQRCPPAGMQSVSISFSHELYCNRFYECLSGQACILECPYGLEYSGGVGRCDEPSKAQCSRWWK